MADGRTRRVFVAMLREEWRMHSHLFRGGHFAAFPVLIAALTAGAAWLLVATGTDLGTVFAAKFRAFLLLGPVIGLAFYALAVAWRGEPLVEVLVGAVLLVGVAYYIFGVTVYLTGLSPNEFLFDTALFAVFGTAMVVPLVPILVVGFALAPVSPGLLVALGAGGIVLGLIGVGLYRRSLPRWSARYRQG